MAALYVDEDVTGAVVAALRAAGHDVLTAVEAGNANRELPDDQQLEFATAAGRAIVTMNRSHYSMLHRRRPHAGIVTCTRTRPPRQVGEAVVAALATHTDLIGLLVRVQADRVVVVPSPFPTTVESENASE